MLNIELGGKRNGEEDVKVFTGRFSTVIFAVMICGKRTTLGFFNTWYVATVPDVKRVDVRCEYLVDKWKCFLTRVCPLDSSEVFYLFFCFFPWHRFCSPFIFLLLFVKKFIYFCLFTSS